MQKLIIGIINLTLLLSALLATSIGWLLVVLLAQLDPYAGLLVPLPLALAWWYLTALPLFRWRRAMRLISSAQQPNPAILDVLSSGLILDTSTNPTTQLRTLYADLADRTEDTISATAETIFFHTAVSQAGQLDTFVLWHSHWQLVNRLVDQYCPGNQAIRPALYAYMLSALLTPNRKEDLNLAAQIGPALVGASIVGAIPGANLISIIISDAVVQGSANALASLRVGLLVQRWFARQVGTDNGTMDDELRAINRQATQLLLPLVSTGSSDLSRMIWNAARDHLKRVPAATLDGLKSMVSKSLKGIGDRLPGKSGSAIEDLLPPGGGD